jgi:hypothetical protein
MQAVKQHFKCTRATGAVSEWDVVHIYAPLGHFEDKAGHPCGWHIQLGTGHTADDFTEVTDEGVSHEVPATLPDVETVEALPEYETEAEAYEAAGRILMGGDSND